MDADEMQVVTGLGTPIPSNANKEWFLQTIRDENGSGGGDPLSENPKTTSGRRLLEDAVRKAFDKYAARLTADERTAMRMRLYDRMQRTDIANSLKIPIGRIGTLIGGARKKLLAFLQEELQGQNSNEEAA
jgi:DNA-directed RNA polymerase specialized sigma24 family protein